MKEEAKRDPQAIRVQTAPGIGPVSAMAIKAFGPDMNSFQRGRDFAAWLGAGAATKVDRRSSETRTHIENGPARHQTASDHWSHDDAHPLGVKKNGAPSGSWLKQMLERKPRLLVAIALANKTARAIWAMMPRDEEYRDVPVSA